MAQTIFYIIIAIILFDFLLERVLEYLNAKSWTEKLPSPLKGLYDAEKYAKAKRYDQANNKIGLLSATLSLMLILGMLFMNGFAWLDEYARSVSENSTVMALLFFGILFIVSDIISLPISLYSTFVIEEKFGFNKMSVKTFFLDKVKGYVLGSVIGGLLFWGFIWFYNTMGENFWLYAWSGFTVFTLFFTMFYTSLIVPIFNKLTPLEDGALRKAIEEYANKVGFSLKNIFVVDGSKRSTKANAYFSGIGSKKSIVLYDTLIEDHTEEELVAILAHEVGHYKKKHVMQSFILGSLQMGIMLYLFSLCVNNPIFSEVLGASEPSFYMSLLAFGLLYSPISTVLGILMNMFSRKNEFEADAFAVQTYEKKPLQEALKGLSIKHLSNLTPHSAYVFVNYSHPPLLKRVEAMNAAEIS